MLQCLGIKIEFTRFRKAKNKALRTPFRHKDKVARFDAYIQNVLKAATGVFFKQVGFPRGDTSHPLNPDVGLSAANIQQFFELTKHYDKNLKIFANLGDFLGSSAVTMILKQKYAALQKYKK